MNLLITINNAQMRTIYETKFISAQMIREKKIQREVKLKREKRIPCVVTVKIQLTSIMKSQTLNKEKSKDKNNCQSRNKHNPFISKRVSLNLMHSQ